MIPFVIVTLLLAEPTRSVRMWAADGSELHAVPISTTRYVVPAHRPLRYIGVQTLSETCGAAKMKLKTPSRAYKATVECGPRMMYFDLWARE